MFYSISTDQLLAAPGKLPPEHESTLPLVVSTTTVLFVLALSTFIARICTRWRLQLGLDDFTMTTAMLLTTACYGCTIAICSITKGKHTVYVPLDSLLANAKTSFVFVFLWFWSVTSIKISVCFMLLRVKSYSQRWLIGLWSLIALLLALVISATITHLLMCQPIQANWDIAMILKPGYCWPVERFINFTYGYSAFFIATDLICALLPIAFLWKIKRPMRERLVLIMLMALGLLASFCGIMKMVDLEPSIRSKDPLYDAAPTQIWALAEAFVGIFAANIPTLRQPLERVFRALIGRTINSLQSTDRHYHGSSYSSQITKKVPPGFELVDGPHDFEFRVAVYTGSRAEASLEYLTASPMTHCK